MQSTRPETAGFAARFRRVIAGVGPLVMYLSIATRGRNNGAVLAISEREPG